MDIKSKTNKKRIVLCDVDNTLVKWLKMSEPITGDMVLNFYGQEKRVKEITVHTEFLKSLKSRGYFIRVHSGNGEEWAETVVKALGLWEYVDSIETKPDKVIDDKPCVDWCHPIYLGDE